MQGLPKDGPLMRQVLRKHLDILSIFSGMGLLFSIIGGAVIWWTHDGGEVIIGAVFLLAGLAILGFGLYSVYSSCLYYYEQGLLNKHGKQVEAIITAKSKQEAVDRNGTSKPEDDVIETDLSVTYRYEWLRRPYESASMIADMRLFEAIEIGMSVPILVMPSHPTITRLQSKKLKRQLNLTNKIGQNSNEQPVSKGLMLDDE